MFLIARQQLFEELADARFLIMSLIVFILFVTNGIIAADRYQRDFRDWQELSQETRTLLEQRADNVQRLANFRQLIVKPPSVLAFIADGGGELLPNALNVNAFQVANPDRLTRANEILFVMPAPDWLFIVGTVMTLMVLLLSFGTVNGGKRDGTLKLLLSYPISRLSLFAGKYIGHLASIVIVLLLGAVANVLVLSVYGAVPLDIAVIERCGWALLLSIACLSFFLLLGMAVSSMTSRPAVSLVILIVIWMLMVTAAPGVASLVGKWLVTAPSDYDVAQQTAAAEKSIRAAAASDAGRWSGDPNAPYVVHRARMAQQLIEAGQKIRDAAGAARIAQRYRIQNIAACSPTGLLAAALERLCGTGISGYESFLLSAQEYRSQLHHFIVERDRLDPDTPHLVYSWGDASDAGTFSAKAVPISSVPRPDPLWLPGGLPRARNVPLGELAILLALNLGMATIAFIALARFDPR